MKPAITKSQTLDEILLTLADEFEAGNRHGRTFQPSSSEEFEPLRECIAEMIADDLLTDEEKMKIYRLTAKGYRQSKPRIDALRALPSLRSEILIPR